MPVNTAPLGLMPVGSGPSRFATLPRDLAHDQDIGVLVATHDTAVVGVADRVVAIQDGLLSEAAAPIAPS